MNQTILYCPLDIVTLLESTRQLTVCNPYVAHTIERNIDRTWGMVNEDPVAVCVHAHRELLPGPIDKAVHSFRTMYGWTAAEIETIRGLLDTALRVFDNLIQHSEYADSQAEAQRLKVRVQIIMQAWAAL